MPKKQIFGSIIILIVLSLICMFIYDEFKDEKNNHQKKLIVEKGGSKLSLYYTDTVSYTHLDVYKRQDLLF